MVILVYAMKKIVKWKFMPHFLSIWNQIGIAFNCFVTQAAFNAGMDSHVYVTYRSFVGGLVILPFAYHLEREMRPRLTLLLLLEIFVLSLLGCSLTLNLYFESLRCTSPTFIATMANTIPSMTFIIAIVLRLEEIDIWRPRGIAKVFGTIISLGGATIITLYKGHVVHNFSSAPIPIKINQFQQNWLKGSFLMVGSCICWASWYILQVYTLRRYPAKLSLTSWMDFMGSLQSAIFTFFINYHKPQVWFIKFNIQLWCILYGGIICAGLIIFTQFWCNKQKGPVFVTMLSPLSTVVVAFSACFLFGQDLHVGSLLRGAVAIIGLYILLWGKEGDHHDDNIKLQLQAEDHQHRPLQNRV